MTLYVHLCPNLIEIQSPDMSASLEELVIESCKSIGRIVLCGEGGSLGVLDRSKSSLSESTDCSLGVLLLPNALKKLEALELRGCRNLLEIQVISTLSSLEGIFIVSCHAMEKLTGISNLKNLHRLIIDECAKLRVVEGLDELEFLTKLNVKNCPSLETLLDISNSKIPDECKILVWGCSKSLDSTSEHIFDIPFERYKKMMVQQGVPQPETKKEKAKMEGDAEEPNTELQLQFHPFASSQCHEPSRFGHLKSLNLGGHTTFERYKRMAQEGAPQSETNKVSLDQVHPSASSEHHEISEEPPMDNVKKRRCLEREIRRLTRTRTL